MTNLGPSMCEEIIMKVRKDKRRTALAKVLNIDENEINIERLKTAWFEVDMFTDWENRHYLVLNDAEHYYNAQIYGVETMQEIGRDEYYIYEMI